MPWRIGSTVVAGVTPTGHSFTLAAPCATTGSCARNTIATSPTGSGPLRTVYSGSMPLRLTVYVDFEMSREVAPSSAESATGLSQVFAIIAAEQAPRYVATSSG